LRFVFHRSFFCFLFSELTVASHSRCILMRAILISCDHFAFGIHFHNGKDREERRAANVKLHQEDLSLARSKLPLMTQPSRQKTSAYLVLSQANFLKRILEGTSTRNYTAVHWKIKHTLIGKIPLNWHHSFVSVLMRGCTPQCTTKACSVEVTRRADTRKKRNTYQTQF